MSCNNKFHKFIDLYRNLLLGDDSRYKNNQYVIVALLLKSTTKFICSGVNDISRQCFNGKATTSIHAEVNCLKNFKGTVSRGFTFLTLHYSKETGELKDSRPCANCVCFLKKKGITNIYCSLNNGTVVKLRLDEIPQYFSKSFKRFLLHGFKSPCEIKKLNIKKLFPKRMK